jgi:acyl-CoA thioesterase FadM
LNHNTGSSTRGQGARGRRQTESLRPHGQTRRRELCSLQTGASFPRIPDSIESHEIKYQQSAFAGDEVTVRTWVADFRRLSCLRRYKIIRRRDEVVLATAATEWAFVNFKTFALQRIPPELATAFEIVRD